MCIRDSRLSRPALFRSLHCKSLLKSRYSHRRTEFGEGVVGAHRRFLSLIHICYADVLAAADRTVVLADSYSRGCYYRRKDYLVEHAVRVVAWYIRRNSGTGYTVRRARHQGIEVLNLYEDNMNPTLF